MIYHQLKTKRYQAILLNPIKKSCWNITNLDLQKSMWSLPVHTNVFLPSIRMSGKNVNFGDKKIKRSDFYKNKKVIKIDDIVVNKILVSKKEPYGSKNYSKYFIEYSDDDVIRRLCIKLPQMIGYVRSFESNLTICFKISDKQL